MPVEETFAGISVPPGDPAGVENLTRSFSSVASNLRSTASRLRSSPSELPSWQGVASLAYAGLCLIAGEDADAAAERMEQAAAAATKYKDELTDARRDAREAIGEARDAKERIEQAKQRIADATDRLAAAQQAMTTAANDMTASASSGVPPVAAQSAFDQASGAADAAEQEISHAKQALERAEEDLERAQQRGKRAEELAKDSATMLRAALMAAAPGAMGLAVGAPASAPGASGANFTGLSPQQVATFFSRIGPEGGARLAQTHPELVGPLDGAPLPLRYAANTALAEREVLRLEGELAGVESELEAEGDGDGGFSFPPLIAPLPIIAGREIVDRLTTSRAEELEAERDTLEGKLEDARAFSDPSRQLLIYDPRGDGRVAEVFGDLGHADHAMVMVPGIGNSMDGFDNEFRGEVQTFHNEANARSGGESATVAWLGYDSPDGFTDPATYENDSAADGGESLARSVDGINAQNPGAHTTVAGHSYGSVVTGNAAAHHGLTADDVVLTGSPGPGPGVDHASDLSRGGEARVWSAAAPHDLVASPPTIPDPPEIPGPVDDQLRELNHVHGPSPATPEFGAQRFDTGPPLEPLISTRDVEVPVYQPGFPLGSIEQVTIPLPDGVNLRYPIDQHTTAYAHPDTLAFRNLVNIAIGERDLVVPAP